MSSSVCADSSTTDDITSDLMLFLLEVIVLDMNFENDLDSGLERDLMLMDLLLLTDFKRDDLVLSML